MRRLAAAAEYRSGLITVTRSATKLTSDNEPPRRGNEPPPNGGLEVFARSRLNPPLHLARAFPRSICGRVAAGNRFAILSLLFATTVPFLSLFFFFYHLSDLSFVFLPPWLDNIDGGRCPGELSRGTPRRRPSATLRFLSPGSYITSSDS